MNDDIQSHLVSLESTIAFQEEAIQKLEKTATAQQLQLQKLERQLGNIEEHLRTALPSLTVEPENDVPPPHY